MKFGVDYRRLFPTSAVSTFQLSVSFASLQQVLNATAGTRVVSARAVVKPRYANFSAYAQDRWTPSRRLTVDFGMRWEINSAPREATMNRPLSVTQIDHLDTMELAARGTSQWRTTYGNVAPRFGIAYQLSQVPGQEAVLRGGAGVFYDTGNNQGSAGVGSYPFFASRSLSNVTFPLSLSQIAPPALPVLTDATPPYGFMFIFDPDLQLPYTLQWNVALERAVGAAHLATVSYVGAVGRRLLQRRQVNVGRVNPLFTTVNVTSNRATSEYNALHAQFRRRLSWGLQALASYTWAHALDEDSTDAGNIVPVRGNAAFDIRHAVAIATTYDIPPPTSHRLAEALMGHWSIDINFRARSAAPVDLVALQVINPVDGELLGVRANVVPGVPFYIEDPSLPGGRRINAAAFATPPSGTLGNLGRNAVRGLGAWQQDVAVRRSFRLNRRLMLQVRAAAFNVFNHPNFGAIQTVLGSSNFGQPTNMLNQQLGGVNPLFQFGGPRSLQFAARLGF